MKNAVIVIMIFCLALNLYSRQGFSKPKVNKFADYEVKDEELLNKYQQESRTKKRRKLYDLSKKNGIDDYKVYMTPPMRGHETKYSSSMNGIIVYKNDMLYRMPYDFHVLLHFENVKIDSSNAFEVAKLFIRLNTTDNVYFDDCYFGNETPEYLNFNEDIFGNEVTVSKAKYLHNVFVITHGDNDRYKMKWGFRFLFSSGRIANVYHIDLDDNGQYKRKGGWGGAGLNIRYEESEHQFMYIDELIDVLKKEIDDR